MLNELPWIISTVAVVAVLVMMCLNGARRRPAGKGPTPARRRSDAAATRQAVMKATRENLERLNAGLEGEDPEGSMADAANRARKERR